MSINSRKLLTGLTFSFPAVFDLFEESLFGSPIDVGYTFVICSTVEFVEVAVPSSGPLGTGFNFPPIVV